MLKKPDRSEYYEFVDGYIQSVPEGNYAEFMETQRDEIVDLFSQVSDEEGGGSYAPGKWTLKEVLGHITDAERVMSYRLLRIARGDTTNLPGFDQNLFVSGGSFGDLSVQTLLEDFKAVRQATLALLTTITDEAWVRKGVVGGNEITARSVAYVIAGHTKHHLQIIRDKYRG